MGDILNTIAAQLSRIFQYIGKPEVRKMNAENQQFCQCCGMPMGAEDDLYGTNAGGSKSVEYCRYCLKNGSFTFAGTMEEMIALCVPHMAAAHPELSGDEARKIMLAWFPTLKRWKK